MDESTERELNQQKEYARQLAAGENPAPLVERVDLEKIAGSENFNRVSQIEAFDQISRSTLRGQELYYHTPSKRLLWQAFGQEHIEPELLDYIDRMPARSTFYDIGASNGIFATYAAATHKNVFCFEPEVANFALLNYNSYLNKDACTFPMCNFNIALSDKTELGKIYIKKFEAGGHLKILDNPVQRGLTEFSPDYVQTTLKYRLDDFIALTKIPLPEFIKIDVDGCELQVITGMTETLKSTSLKKIFIELEDNNENSRRCHQILIENGFTVEQKKRVQNYFGENNFIFSR